MNPPIATGAEPCRVAPDRWFPGQSDNHMTAIAKQVCMSTQEDGRPSCPILDACREWGIRHELFGVWGGLSRDERKAIRKARDLVVEVPLAGVSYPQRKSGPDHGDEAGYKRHIRRYEKPCEPCHEGNLRARQDRAKRQAAS